MTLSATLYPLARMTSLDETKTNTVLEKRELGQPWRRGSSDVMLRFKIDSALPLGPNPLDNSHQIRRVPVDAQHLGGFRVNNLSQRFQSQTVCELNFQLVVFYS